MMQDKILSLLKTAGTRLIEDDELIRALNDSKRESEDMKKKLDDNKRAEKKIDALRETYRACAVRASICFFVLSDMALVDPMYQFSLKAYIDLFIGLSAHSLHAC